MRRLAADFQTLELTAKQAGSAWACTFASSAEYEAALIKERRDAGRYQRRERGRLLLAIGIGMAIVVLTLLSF